MCSHLGVVGKTLNVNSTSTRAWFIPTQRVWRITVTKIHKRPPPSPHVQGGWSQGTKADDWQMLPVNLSKPPPKQFVFIRPRKFKLLIFCLGVYTAAAHSSSKPTVAPEMQRHRKDQTDRASFLHSHHYSPRSWRNPYVPDRTAAEGQFWL